MHPLVCRLSIESDATDSLTALPILGRKASGFLSRHCDIAFWRSFSFERLLKQFVQLQPLQNSPFAKQSQYNFKHCDFVQLHGFLLGTSLVVVDGFVTGSGKLAMLSLFVVDADDDIFAAEELDGRFANVLEDGRFTTCEELEDLLIGLSARFI